MIYLLYGEEDFLIQDALARIRAGFGSGDMLELNTVRLDGGSVSYPEFEAAVSTIPFLADCRLVLVDGLLKRFEPRRNERAGQQAPAEDDAGDDSEDGADAAPTTAAPRRNRLEGGWEHLADLLTRLPETTQLILTDGKIPATNIALKAITPAAKVQTFGKLKGAPLTEWVRNRAKLHDCKLSPKALTLLLQLGGDDLRLFDSELQKLALYAAGQTVDEAMVQTLVPMSAETLIFGLTDAFAERRLKAAHRELQRLLADGAAPVYILFMLARHVRAMIQARELSAMQVPEADMMREMGMFNRYPFEKTVDQSRYLDTPTLVQTLNRLLEADVQMKTGKLEPELALQLLVTELCGQGEPSPVRRRY